MQPHHEVLPKNSPATELAKRLGALVPQLETPRLRLKAPTLADFAHYAEIAFSPAGRFLLENSDRDDVWYDYTNMIAGWLLRGHGLWALEHCQIKNIIGFALLGFEPGDHEPELGYMILPEHEGLGYATEAAKAAQTFAFNELNFSTLVSTIDHENIPSQTVAKKLGGKRDKLAEQAHKNQIQVFRYFAPK